MFCDKSRLLGSLIALVALLALAAMATAAPRGGEEIDAVVGSPFGVGKITVVMPRAEGVSDDESTYSLSDRDGRTLYAVFTAEPVRAILRQALDRPRRVTAYFLFTGDAPLTVTLNAGGALNRDIQPRADRGAYDRLLNEWWRGQTQNVRRDGRNDEYPQLVNNYVTSMLARRLNLPPPEPGAIGRIGAQIGGQLLSGGGIQLGNGGGIRIGGGQLGNTGAGAGDVGSSSDSGDASVGLFLGTEKMRANVLKQTMLRGVAPPEPVDQPLPTTAAPPPLDYPDPGVEVPLESIASHVPHECFYVRFGSFNNYIWLRSVLDEWAGDLRNMMSLRGVDYGNSARIERQLVLKETALSRVLGGTVIADVAILGMDTFVREGAAAGIMFQARNNFVLGNSISQQRKELLDANKNATETQVEIAGHQVSFLSTPDNSVRSFYAVDGDFHLVTTSKRIVERFFEAGQGKDSLAGSREFKHARAVMPLSRDDSIFAYVPDAFLRQLIGPAYHIEMQRRLQAVTDIELVYLARLAARAERKPFDTIEQLVAGGLLPPGFGQRSDGSRLVVNGDTITDSLRGARGTFLPVADVEVAKVTPSEVAAYRDFAQSFRDKWQQTEPIMAGIQRVQTNGAVANGGAVQASANVPASNPPTPNAPPTSTPPANTTTNTLPATGPTPEVLPPPKNSVATGGNGNGGNNGNSAASGTPGFGNAGKVQGAINDNSRERIVVDVYVAPFSMSHLGMANGFIGPASKERLAPIEGDAASLELSLAGGLFGGPGGPYHLFAGVRDAPPPMEMRDQSFRIQDILRQFANFYIGAWPRPGALEFFGFRNDAPPNRQQNDVWQQRVGDFALLAFQPNVLDSVGQQLRIVEDERPAQVHLFVGDISQSRVAGLASNFAYRRARDTSLGNTRFLTALANQLHVPREQCLAVGQKILDVRLVCPLGGEYQLKDFGDGTPVWISTALLANNTPNGQQAPFNPPPLNWFRGLDLDAGAFDNQLTAHAVIDVQHKTTK